MERPTQTPEQLQAEREFEWKLKNRDKLEAQPVKIVDVSIPFWSLVWLIVRMAFAVIPAAVIVFFIWTALLALFGRHF